MTKQPTKLETLMPISAAALVTSAVMYPVDVLRALKMASASGPGYTIQQFVKTHGLRGVMTQGLVPEITRATWMRILKFFFFPITFELFWNKKPSQGCWYEKGLAGACAVIPEVLTITSLELAKIGLQLDSEKRYRNSTTLLFKDVYAKQGIAGLMAGWQGVQLRQSLWTGTYFATLDAFKRFTKNVIGIQDQSTVNFAAGFFAGVAGAIANTPFDVVRTGVQKNYLQQLQSGTLQHSSTAYAASYPLYFNLMGDIIKQRGLKTCFNGFLMKSLHMGGSGACVALMIPQFAKFMGFDPATLM